MYLQTLGALELQDVTYTRPKSLLLLSYLALEGGRDRRHLGELFFGQAQDALASLRVTLSRLRHAVPGSIEEDGPLIKVTLNCDARILLSHLDAGDLEVGVGLYSGSFLSGLHLPDWGVELEEWVYATREYIASRVRAALLTLGERTAARGDFSEAAALGERALTLEAAPEPEVEQLVRLGTLLRAGESPLLAKLIHQARSVDLTLEGSVDESRRALRREEPFAANRGPRGLPLRSTSFVGRQVERAEVQRALDRPEVRLLTLVGPGGIGKTRLALEVARSARDRGAAAFVSLEAATSLLTLPDSFACALGLTLSTGVPPFEALLAALKDQALLLVLDSVEHLLKGAPYLSHLLRDCPVLTILVTSRERLGLEEEFVLTLGGLTVPAANGVFEEVRHAEAVELFVSRAKRARLDFELRREDLAAVCEVCQLVGGSPLGIELAAAWVKLMPVADIAEEIRRSLDFLEATDRAIPAKHHSVRLVFEQTWRRLTDAERTVLVRLAVFRGGFTREAAGTVAGVNLPALARLVDKSLVRPAEHGRYDFHVLLRQFTREALARNPEERERSEVAHGAYFLDFARQAGNGFRQLLNEKRWVERINRDIENIRAALEDWLSLGQVAPALDCVIDLRNYWARTGRMREARRWLRRVLEAADLEDRLKQRALALDGELAINLHEYREGQRQLEAALALAQEAGVNAPLQWLHLGVGAQLLGDLEAARHHFERALNEFRSNGETAGVAAALNNLGAILTETGDYGAALQHFDQALEAKREIGGDADSVLTYLGNLYLRMNRLDASGDHFAQALRGLVERGFYNHIPEVLEGLGLVASARGQVQEASVLLGAAERQREVVDSVMSVVERDRFDAHLAPLSAAMGAVAFEAAWNEGRAMTRERAVEYALRNQRV